MAPCLPLRMAQSSQEDMAGRGGRRKRLCSSPFALRYSSAVLARDTSGALVASRPRASDEGSIRTCWWRMGCKPRRGCRWPVFFHSGRLPAVAGPSVWNR